MKWELIQLENAVRDAHGNRYAEAIHDPLHSVSWKSDMMTYHACEAENVLNDAIAGTPGIDDDDSQSITFGKAAIVAAAPCEAGQRLRTARFKAEAHVIASAQALHSLCDIICHVVYWAYQLDTVPNAPKTNRLNLHLMLRTLSTLPHFVETASLIQAVVDAPEFTYLAAYVNTTKHRSLVSSTLSASFGTNENGGMTINAFSYTDLRGHPRKFARKWADDFLRHENQALLNRLVAIGNSLNNYFT